MANTYTLKIISPEQVLYDGQVESLIAPGYIGYLGVLANHAPLLTPLQEGTVTIRDESGAESQYDLKEGILEVCNNEATILTEKITKKIV